MDLDKLHVWLQTNQSQAKCLAPQKDLSMQVDKSGDQITLQKNCDEVNKRVNQDFKEFSTTMGLFIEELQKEKNPTRLESSSESEISTASNSTDLEDDYEIATKKSTEGLQKMQYLQLYGQRPKSQKPQLNDPQLHALRFIEELNPRCKSLNITANAFDNSTEMQKERPPNSTSDDKYKETSAVDVRIQPLLTGTVNSPANLSSETSLRELVIPEIRINGSAHHPNIEALDETDSGALNYQSLESSLMPNNTMSASTNESSQAQSKKLPTTLPKEIGESMAMSHEPDSKYQDVKNEMCNEIQSEMFGSVSVLKNSSSPKLKNYGFIDLEEEEEDSSTDPVNLEHSASTIRGVIDSFNNLMDESERQKVERKRQASKKPLKAASSKKFLQDDDLSKSSKNSIEKSERKPMQVIEMLELAFTEKDRYSDTDEIDQLPNSHDGDVARVSYSTTFPDNVAENHSAKKSPRLTLERKPTTMFQSNNCHLHFGTESSSLQKKESDLFRDIDKEFFEKLDLNNVQLDETDDDRIVQCTTSYEELKAILHNSKENLALSDEDEKILKEMLDGAKVFNKTMPMVLTSDIPKDFTTVHDYRKDTSKEMDQVLTPHNIEWLSEEENVLFKKLVDRTKEKEREEQFSLVIPTKADIPWRKGKQLMENMATIFSYNQDEDQMDTGAEEPAPDEGTFTDPLDSIGNMFSYDMKEEHYDMSDPVCDDDNSIMKRTSAEQNDMVEKRSSLLKDYNKTIDEEVGEILGKLEFLSSEFNEMREIISSQEDIPMVLSIEDADEKEKTAETQESNHNDDSELEPEPEPKTNADLSAEDEIQGGEEN